MIWTQEQLYLKIKELENGNRPLGTMEVSNLLGISTKTVIDYLKPVNLIRVTKEKNNY